MTAEVAASKLALEQQQTATLEAQEQIAQLNAALVELKPANPEVVDGIPEIVKPYVAEIESLEQEVKNLKESLEGFNVSVHGKNDELLRIIHVLKSSVDEKDFQLQSLNKTLEVKSRNAADAEDMELRLLREVADITTERDAAIAACDIFRNHITSLAKELGGAQGLVPETDASSAVELARIRLLEQENSTQFIQSQISKLDQTLATIASRSKESREAAASHSEETSGVGSNLNDPQLYLVTIDDLREQILVNRAGLEEELNKRQTDLSTARTLQEKLQGQVEELRTQRQAQIDASMKTINNLIISNLAIATASRAEAIAVVSQSNAVKELQYTSTIEGLETELEITKRDLEVARSRPTTADVSLATTKPQEEVILVEEPVVGIAVENISSSNDGIEATSPAAATATATVTEPDILTLTDTMPFDPDEICNPSLFLPKVGARKKRTASPSPQRPVAEEKLAVSGGRPFSGSNGRPRTPSLDEQIQKFYTPQRKIGDRPSGITIYNYWIIKLINLLLFDGTAVYLVFNCLYIDPSTEAALRAKAKEMRSEYKVNDELPTDKDATTVLQQKELSMEDVDQYCNQFIAQETELERKLIASVDDRDKELKELRIELFSVQQALATARGELVVKLMALNESDQHVARMQSELAEVKFVLSKSDEKVRNIEYRREQAEYQKSLVEEKLNEYMKIARKVQGRILIYPSYICVFVCLFVQQYSVVVLYF